MKKLTTLLISSIFLLFTAVSCNSEDYSNGYDNNGDTTPVDPTTDTIRFSIESVAQFMDYMPRIKDSADITDPMRNITVVADVAPLGFDNADQLTPLSDKAYAFRNRTNTTLNWATWYPQSPRTLIDYTNHFRRAGSPNLTGVPYKWEVTVADYPHFQAAGQTGIEVYVPWVDPCAGYAEALAELRKSHKASMPGLRYAMVRAATYPADMSTSWNPFFDLIIPAVAQTTPPTFLDTLQTATMLNNALMFDFGDLRNIVTMTEFNYSAYRFIIKETETLPNLYDKYSECRAKNPAILMNYASKN